MPHPIPAAAPNLLFIHTEREGTTIHVQTAWRKQMGDQSLTTLSTTLGNNAGTLAAAVVANTPAVTTPPVVAPTVPGGGTSGRF